MPSPSISAAERSDYLGHLTVIREDPQVKKLARTWAEDPDLAEDALQETFYVIAGIEHPERIEDLKKYFCSLVVRKALWLRGQLGVPGVVQ